MADIKKCALCGKSNQFNNRLYTDRMIKPINLEEKYYYDLWHKYPECCSQCGYTSFDISECKNLDIINNKQFLDVVSDQRIAKFVDKLSEYNHNYLLKDYLRAGAYYNSVNDKYNEGVSYLLASEEINRFLLYYDKEVSEDDSNVQDNVELEFEDFARSLFNYGLGCIEEMYNNNPNDKNVIILYVGLLLSSDEEDQQQARVVLNNCTNVEFSAVQKKVIKYLLNN